MESEPIGLRLKRLREELGLKQKEVADKAEYSIPQIQKMEGEYSNPPFGSVIRYIKACGKTTAEFFGSKIPDDYPSEEQRSLHSKLQEILEADGRFKAGIEINLESIVSLVHMESRKKKEATPKKARRRSSQSYGT